MRNKHKVWLKALEQLIYIIPPEIHQIFQLFPQFFFFTLEQYLSFMSPLNYKI